MEQHASRTLELKLKNRFKQSLVGGCFTGIAAHFLCAVYFYITGVTEMLYYDIAITIYFAGLTYLVLNNYNLKMIFFMATVEMILHGYLCSYFVGYECDFIFFVLALPCVLLLDTTWKRWQIITYLIFLTLVFSYNYIVFEDVAPVYILSDSLIRWTSIVMSYSAVIIILTILFYFSKAVGSNEASLRDVCITLEHKNDENKAMLKEIHHRVKNNLQVINSLLSMQSRYIDDEEVVGMLKESQRRIMTIAAVHEKLYNAENLKEINVKEHITTLVTELISGCSITNREVNLKINIELFYLDIENLIPLGLMINEIVINSLKHAFPEEKGNLITVELRKKEDDFFELIIGDNGIGFEEAAVVKKGLGQKLILIFAKQLNGVIETLEQKGKMYRITFQKISHV